MSLTPRKKDCGPWASLPLGGFEFAIAPALVCSDQSNLKKIVTFKNLRRKTALWPGRHWCSDVPLEESI